MLPNHIYVNYCVFLCSISHTYDTAQVARNCYSLFFIIWVYFTLTLIPIFISSFSLCLLRTLFQMSSIYSVLCYSFYSFLHTHDHHDDNLHSLQSYSCFLLSSTDTSPPHLYLFTSFASLISFIHSFPSVTLQFQSVTLSPYITHFLASSALNITTTGQTTVV